MGVGAFCACVRAVVIGAVECPGWVAGEAVVEVVGGAGCALVVAFHALEGCCVQGESIEAGRTFCEVCAVFASDITSEFFSCIGNMALVILIFRVLPFMIVFSMIAVSFVVHLVAPSV